MTAVAGRGTSGPGWAAWAMGAGGLLMAGVWLVFTSLHGPTSFNEGRSLLGHDMHGWGLLLGVGPNILIAAALVALRPRVVRDGRRLASAGHAIVVALLLASAALDLLFLALGPPLFMPLIGIGAIVLALGLRGSTAFDPLTPRVVGLLGLVLLTGAGLSYAPMEWSDSVGGYRIFGAIGHLTAGLVWAGLAVTLGRGTRPTEAGSA